MLDLSKYAKDKDSYIVRLEIDELFQNFKVIYASGREVIHGFSIHNYQVFIYKMEEQFQEYILAFIGSMIVIYNLNKIADKRSKLTKDAEKAAIIELLLQHKEDIALNVTDPGTGRKDKWYMIDINNVDQFGSVLEMAMYTMPYSNPVIKEEMEKDLDKAFSDAYTLKMKNKNS